MANAYRTLGKDEEALVGYRRFMELDPKNAQIRYEAAQILIDRGELAEARSGAAAGAEAAAVDGRRAQRARRHRAEDGRRRRAPRTEIRSAIALKSGRPARAFQSRAARRAARRPERGRSPSTSARSSCIPASYKAQFNLGRLYEQIGDVPAQLEAYKKAIEINPNFAEGHLFLAKLYLDLGQKLDEAVRLAQKGLPARADVRVRAARALRHCRRLRARGTRGRFRAPGGTRACTGSANQAACDAGWCHAINAAAPGPTSL